MTYRHGYFDIRAPRLDHRTRYLPPREWLGPLGEDRATYDLMVGTGLTGAHLITPDSPRTLHMKIHDIALLFRREFSYDFIRTDSKEATRADA